MLWIDTPQQFTFIETQAQRMICLPRSGFPRGLLPCEDGRHSIEVRDNTAIDRLVNREQTCLVCQELAHGDSLFALLRELRPVLAHSFFIVKPAARVSDGKRHGGQALGSRVDDDHGVFFPRLTRPLVPNAAPQINNVFTAMKNATGAAQFTSPAEVFNKRLAHGLKTAADAPLNTEAF